jgi:hypothetical protein
MHCPGSACSLYIFVICTKIFTNLAHSLSLRPPACTIDVYYASSSIAIALTSKKVIKYDRKVRCELKWTFTIVIYDHNTFIIQATGVYASVEQSRRQVLDFGGMNYIRLVRDKRPSLLWKGVIYVRKSFYWIGDRRRIFRTVSSRRRTQRRMPTDLKS